MLEVVNYCWSIFVEIKEDFTVKKMQEILDVVNEELGTDFECIHLENECGALYADQKQIPEFIYGFGYEKSVDSLSDLPVDKVLIARHVAKVSGTRVCVDVSDYVDQIFHRVLVDSEGNKLYSNIHGLGVEGGDF